MLEEQKAKWLASSREAWDVPAPEGWRKLDSMPVTQPAEWLYADGGVRRGIASNPEFVLGHGPIAWREAKR